MSCKHFTVADAVVKPAPLKFCRQFVGDTMGAYCHVCDTFHHVVQEVIQVVRGPANARSLFSASSKLNGQHIIRWAVGEIDSSDRRVVETVEYSTYPRRYNVTEEPLIFQMWELLMMKVKVIIDDKPEYGAEGTQAWSDAKQQARGIAEALALLMKPFMETADDVVKAAVAYHKDPAFEVPGLGLHLWNPMKNPDGSDRTPISAKRTTTPPKAAPKARPKVDNTSKNKLTDKEREGIKEAVGSGMFTKEDVASMFKVSMAEVESALSS